MTKQVDLIIPIKRRISWIVPENEDDKIKLASVNKLSTLTFRQLVRLRDYIDYILEVVSKKDQKDAILTIIYICANYNGEIIKSNITNLIRLTETLMGTKVEEYPDYETILNILSERSAAKHENRRI